MVLTAPQEVPVVATVKRLLPAMPKRTSFPSMLTLCTPSLATSGLPLLSAHCRTPKATTRMKSITPSSIHPWRVLPTMTPKV